jgi:hypothetical protein
MSRAVIRTVVDPATGETVDLMAFHNHGKVRFQRLAPFEERASPKALDNIARFGEISSHAFGQRRSADGTFPTWRALRDEIPKTPLTLPGKSEEAEAKQRRYQELLGTAVPGMFRELLLRRTIALPTLARPRSMRTATLEDQEQRLRERLSVARAPYLR